MIVRVLARYFVGALFVLSAQFANAQINGQSAPLTPAAVAGDDLAVHQARVTSRRLREAVPVLATGLTGSKAGKARKKIRRLTRALGSVRELDVIDVDVAPATFLLIDDFDLRLLAF